MSKIQSIRGMPDILPDDAANWRRIETTVIDVLQRYGYQEIRLPLLEKSELFRRGIGEVTDIVEKEMYSFPDRKNESLSLRPEGTAGCVRAAIQHGLLERPQRLWYSGPMFRYERPQQGRQRQFHQFGVEIFGLDGPDIDAELLAMTAQFWQQLGLTDAVELEINSLGTAASREKHRSQLMTYLRDHQDELDEDSTRRLESNPLRILDTKNPQMQTLVNEAPVLLDYLDMESAEHFSTLQELLVGLGIQYRVNTRLVRGLDYYSRTVFEWVTDKLGAQGTVCGGGRYDGLIEQLGHKPCPALGFGFGMERLVLLVAEVLKDTAKKETLAGTVADVYIVHGDAETLPAMQLAEQLRADRPDTAVQLHCGGGSYKSQFKKADRSGAEFAIVVGEEEVAKQIYTVKPLRTQAEQMSLAYPAIVEYLSNGA